MATIAPSRPSRLPRGSSLPLLLPGDHMDRATFHDRYAAMPDGPKFELIGGVVYMSPLYTPHGESHAEVMAWLVNYKAATPGVRVLDNTTVLLADDGEPQPDAALIIAEGGQTWQEDDYLAGPPELVVEVAYSSDTYDLHSKKRDYERRGVREYVVVVLREPRVVWFIRRGERFEEQSPGEDGLLRSEVFPGLWLDPGALLRHDSNAVRATVELGSATPEHADFVRRLAG